MIIFSALILTAITFIYVTYPLFKQQLHSAESVEDESLQELHSRRDTIYSMLKEIEFDYQSGILTDEDYHDLETRYKRKAIATLKDLDGMKKGTKIDKEIEKQVLEIRRSQGWFCSQCGVKRQEADRFCSHCGASLSGGKGDD